MCYLTVLVARASVRAVCRGVLVRMQSSAELAAGDFDATMLCSLGAEAHPKAGASARLRSVFGT